MVYLIKDIISYLENLAPTAYQESYDNAGLIVGDPMTEVKGIICSLDVTEDVVKEAKEKNCKPKNIGSQKGDNIKTQHFYSQD